jgi:hypothetical protein
LSTADILEIASSVSTPLGLAGLVCAILFFVARQLLRTVKFSKLAGQQTLQLARLIIDRLFVLSLVAIVLAMGAYVYTRSASPRSPGSALGKWIGAKDGDTILVSLGADGNFEYKLTKGTESLASRGKYEFVTPRHLRLSGDQKDEECDFDPVNDALKCAGGELALYRTQ